MFQAPNCLSLGGLTVYCFGDPANMSDPSKKLALRIHDEVGSHTYMMSCLFFE